MKKLRTLLSRQQHTESCFPIAQTAPRVLVVANDASVRQRLARALFDDGYVAITTAGAGLLDRARRVGSGNQPAEVDVIICDIRGLGPRELAALKVLRRYDWVMPIILITQATHRLLEEYALHLHAELIVSELVDGELVSAKLKELLGPLGTPRSAGTALVLSKRHERPTGALRLLRFRTHSR